MGSWTDDFAADLLAQGVYDTHETATPPPYHNLYYLFQNELVLGQESPTTPGQWTGRAGFYKILDPRNPLTRDFGPSATIYFDTDGLLNSTLADITLCLGFHATIDDVSMGVEAQLGNTRLTAQDNTLALLLQAYDSVDGYYTVEVPWQGAVADGRVALTLDANGVAAANNNVYSGAWNASPVVQQVAQGQVPAATMARFFANGGALYPYLRLMNPDPSNTSLIPPLAISEWGYGYAFRPLAVPGTVVIGRGRSGAVRRHKRGVWT